VQSSTNLVDLVISEDSDNIPYGCSDILFKLDYQGNCQRLVLSDLFSRVIPGFDLRTFSQEMIVTMCIASGCDYLVSFATSGSTSLLPHCKQ
jgi:exonuclease-1